MDLKEINEALEIGVTFAKYKFLLPKNLLKPDASFGDLFYMLLEEISGLTAAVNIKLDNPTPGTSLDVILECADVINFACLIMRDVYKESLIKE